MGRVVLGLSPLIAGGLLLSVPVHAQATAGNSSVCFASEYRVSEVHSSQLFVACGPYGVTLGSVDDYEIIQLPALEAALVITTLDEARRVWLVTKNGESDPSLEEITGTIEFRAGRGVGSGIEGVDLDFGAAAAGLLTATTKSQGAVNGKSVTVNLFQMVQRSRDLRNAVPTGSGQ